MIAHDILCGNNITVNYSIEHNGDHNIVYEGDHNESISLVSSMTETALINRESG